MKLLLMLERQVKCIIMDTFMHIHGKNSYCLFVCCNILNIEIENVQQISDALQKGLLLSCMYVDTRRCTLVQIEIVSFRKQKKIKLFKSTKI